MPQGGPQVDSDDGFVISAPMPFGGGAVREPMLAELAPGAVGQSQRPEPPPGLRGLGLNLPQSEVRVVKAIVDLTLTPARRVGPPDAPVVSVPDGFRQDCSRLWGQGRRRLRKSGGQANFRTDWGDWGSAQAPQPCRAPCERRRPATAPIRNGSLAAQARWPQSGPKVAPGDFVGPRSGVPTTVSG